MCAVKNENVLEKSVDALVVALCADYRRRAALIADENTSSRVKVELRYINCKIAGAAGEIAPSRYVPIFIDEIGSRTGYAKSAVDGLSETAYKLQKLQIKRNIVKKLHLADI